jgi:hypothetical protein
MKKKPKINSRQKGAAGERELAIYLRERGYAGARRGQQFKGGTDSPDVVVPGLDDFHIECKRVEAGNPDKWLAQAIRDARSDQVPVVMHRKSRGDWMVILRLDDFLNLVLTKGLKPCPLPKT